MLGPSFRRLLLSIPREDNCPFSHVAVRQRPQCAASVPGMDAATAER